MKQVSLTPELKCSDYRESLNFYTEVLGFAVLYKREEEGFAMLDRQGARLMIDSLELCQRFVKFEMEKPYGRGINLQILTTDVDGLYADVNKKGWPIYLGMEEKWYRTNDTEVGNKQFLVQDPDGYVLRFFEDLGERKINAKVRRSEVDKTKKT